MRNFETTKLKVNDANSNPIEIAAIIVWKVIETAEAAFEVDNYEQYVHVQSEAALRTLATHYPYDAHEDKQVALSTHIDEVSAGIASALRDRLSKAGVEVIEARISHLAYAPEIASAMLRRQQASAIIAARKKIVEGAVSMVENALELLSEKNIVTARRRAKGADGVQPPRRPLLGQGRAARREYRARSMRERVARVALSAYSCHSCPRASPNA